MIYKENSIVLESVFIPNNCVEILKAGTRIYNLKGTSNDEIKFINSVGEIEKFDTVIKSYKNILHNNSEQIIEKYNKLYFDCQDFLDINFGYDDLINEIIIAENDIAEFEKNVHGYINSISQKCCNENCNGRGYKICGAHVTLNPFSRNIQEGNKFYIVPLCDSCNQEYYEPIILADDIPAIVGTWDGIIR